MNYLIKEPNFRMMSLRAHPWLQSRKEISEEKKDPQVSPSLTMVLYAVPTLPLLLITGSRARRLQRLRHTASVAAVPKF